MTKQQALRARHLADWRCVECGLMRKPERTQSVCEWCAERANERVKKHVAKMQREGRCPHCGKLRMGVGALWCQACCERRNARRRKAAA